MRSSPQRSPEETLSGLISDARISLAEIEGAHDHTSQLVQDALDRIEASAKNIPARKKNMKSLVKKWGDIPRRGDCPPIRLLVSSEIDGKGNLRISWAPRLSGYDHQQTFHRLLMTEFGPNESTTVIPRFREMAMMTARLADANGSPDHLVLALRYTMWSGISLGRLISSSLGTIVPTAQIRDLDITLSGEVNDKNLEREQFEQLTSWLRKYDSGNHSAPLSLLHYAHTTGMSALTLRDMCAKAGMKDIKLLETTRSLKQVGQIINYNTSWWRTGSSISLPEPKGFCRT